LGKLPGIIHLLTGAADALAEPDTAGAIQQQDTDTKPIRARVVIKIGHGISSPVE
jgi:hypothetical protein